MIGSSEISMPQEGGVHQVPLQDGQEILRGGHRGDTGSRRHHTVTDCKGKHHQQFGLQDIAGPAQVHE